MKQLTIGQKRTLDFVLGAAGAVAGFAVSAAAGFGTDAPFITVVGMGVGYAVSDTIAYVDNGTLPTVAELAAQVESLIAAKNAPVAKRRSTSSGSSGKSGSGS